jgi:hypothetical protein
MRNVRRALDVPCGHGHAAVGTLQRFAHMAADKTSAAENEDVAHGVLQWGLWVKEQAQPGRRASLSGQVQVGVCALARAWPHLTQPEFE